MEKKLYRNTGNKMISGVCSGIADYFGIDVTLVRLIVAALTFFSACFPGIILYLIFALVVPVAPEAQNGAVPPPYPQQPPVYPQPPYPPQNGAPYQPPVAPPPPAQPEAPVQPVPYQDLQSGSGPEGE